MTLNSLTEVHIEGTDTMMDRLEDAPEICCKQKYLSVKEENICGKGQCFMLDEEQLKFVQKAVKYHEFRDTHSDDVRFLDKELQKLGKKGNKAKVREQLEKPEKVVMAVKTMKSTIP